MRRTFQWLSTVALIILFTLSTTPDIFSKGGGFGRSSRSSYSSRRSSTRSYSTPSRSRTTPTRRSSTAGQRSTRRSTATTSGSSVRSTPRQSTATRQRQSSMNRSRTSSAASTRNMTSRQVRGRKAQQRGQVRQLKSQNRQLKRQNRGLQRDNARERRLSRQANSPITVNNFGSYYPMGAYSMYPLASSMMFGNLMAGIYFHDYYNHRLRHSWMWHYHHRDYDRSHWSRERQGEYERWRAYYDSQGVKPDSNYVDPGTNRDEDYTETHVQENPDKFYGAAASQVTVDELPNEAELRDEVLAAYDPNNTQATGTSTQPQRMTVEKKVVVQKKTSGGTWFLLLFGSLLIVGIIALVMYNKGYF